MGQNGKLQPGAIRAIVIGGDHVEREFPLELGEGFSCAPRPAANTTAFAGERLRLVATAEYSK